jgi:hypothetical protein
MNPKEQPEAEEALRKVLRGWTVDSPLPPRFQEGVWQRIGRAEGKPAAGGWPGLSRLVELILPRPKFAFAYLGVVLAMGVAAGAWAAQVKTSRLDSELSARYVQSLDPYLAGPSPR